MDVALELDAQELNSKTQYLQTVKLRPFSVHSYSEFQISILRKVLKDVPLVVLNFDATGNMVQKPSDIKTAVFYYALTIRVHIPGDRHGFIIPMAEMATSRHDVMSVKCFLDEYRTFATKQLKRWPVFHKILTDMSFVNLNSMALVFNRMSLSEYIDWTYKRIFNRTENSQFVEIILCCSHKVKNLVKDVNKYYTTSVRHNIIEMVCSIINMTDYDTILKLWRNLCVVLLSGNFDENVTVALTNIKSLICRDIELESCIKDAQKTYDDGVSIYFFVYTLAT